MSGEVKNDEEAKTVPPAEESPKEEEDVIGLSFSENDARRKELNDAAARIQARFKGNQTRQQLNEEKGVANDNTGVSKSDAVETDENKKEERVSGSSEEEAAAVKIQSRWKGGQQRAEAKKEEEAAVTIQSRWKGHEARKGADEKPKEEDGEKEEEKETAAGTPEEEAAAVAIQSRWKGGQQRAEAKKKEEAAVTIQSRWKGHEARKGASKEVGDVKEEETVSGTPEEEAAAVAIQSRWKGGHQREEAKKEAEAKEEEEAAIKIQSRWKGHEARKGAGTAPSKEEDGEEVKEEEEAVSGSAEEEAAAVKIQSRWKGGQQRKAAQDAKEEEAAIKIQSRYKGHAERKKRLNHIMENTPSTDDQSEADDEHAAVAIQSRWRGHQYRKEKEEQTQAVTKIQSRWRGNRARQEVMELIVEEQEEEDEPPTEEMLEEMYQQAMEEQERMQARNVVLQRKLAMYFASKKTEDAQRDTAEKSVMDLEKRYLNHLQLVRDLRTRLAEVQVSYSKKVAELKGRLLERQQRADEAAADISEFKREVALTAEHARTGRGLQRTMISSHESAIQAKDADVQHVRLRHITLRNRMSKLANDLRTKEELGDGLHLIDFEQLKIENHGLSEKIEERNEEVLKLRKKITHTVQVLTHLKEKLQYVQGENQELKRHLAELDQIVTKQRDALNQVKRSRDVLRMENATLRQESGLMGKADLLLDFERRKAELVQMQHQLGDLQARHVSLLAETGQLIGHEM